MTPAPSLQRLVRTMDDWLMPDASHLTLSPVCVALEANGGVENMDESEAREIMAGIDARSSALLAVLAIILATSAVAFSLDQTWLTRALLFGLVVTVSVSIVFLLRCLVCEASPRLRHVFEMREDETERCLPIEAIKQMLCVSRVIVRTAVTTGLFFIMSMLVGVDAILRGDVS